MWGRQVRRQTAPVGSPHPPLIAEFETGSLAQGDGDDEHDDGRVRTRCTRNARGERCVACGCAVSLGRDCHVKINPPPYISATRRDAWHGTLWGYYARATKSETRRDGANEKGTRDGEREARNGGKTDKKRDANEKAARHNGNTVNWGKDESGTEQERERDKRRERRRDGKRREKWGERERKRRKDRRRNRTMKETRTRRERQGKGSTKEGGSETKAKQNETKRNEGVQERNEGPRTKSQPIQDTQPRARSNRSGVRRQGKSMTTTMTTSTHAKPGTGTYPIPIPARSLDHDRTRESPTGQTPARSRLSPAFRSRSRLPRRARRQTVSLAVATLYAPRSRRNQALRTAKASERAWHAGK
ncbi:hypothetical protein IMY05_C4779000100 [Salix suchowensis]|nr:hypothetical protein IMY05_C4779000100 [Salix suchowensis]